MDLVVASRIIVYIRIEVMAIACACDSPPPPDAAGPQLPLELLQVKTCPSLGVVVATGLPCSPDTFGAEYGVVRSPASWTRPGRVLFARLVLVVLVYGLVALVTSVPSDAIACCKKSLRTVPQLSLSPPGVGKRTIPSHSCSVILKRYHYNSTRVRADQRIGHKLSTACRCDCNLGVILIDYSPAYLYDEAINLM